MRPSFAVVSYRFVLFVCAVVASAPSESRLGDEMAVRIGSKRLSAAAEGNHTCFVRADGNVLCWGGNASGQIGDGTSGNVRNLPTLVSSITTAVGVASGRDHSCALLANGTVRCWGSNANGQLGVGSATASSNVPLTIANLSSVVSITAGTLHTCARLSNGTARCWGFNGGGRLGDGSLTTRFTPVAVADVNDVVKLAAGANHTCAVRGSGRLSCWGANGQGQLGTGEFANRSRPADVVDIDGVIDVVVGVGFSCARRGTNLSQRVFMVCWGDNDLGQLAIGSASDNSNRPVGLSSGLFDEDPLELFAGRAHACQIVKRRVECWGANGSGQLGVGSTSAFVPSIVRINSVEHALEGAGGADHSCILTNREFVRCWGANALGQLGNTGTEPSLQPIDVLGPSGSISARSLGAGTNHSCAVRAEGAAACWGRNDGGAIGDGTFTDRLVPTAVQSTAAFFTIVGGGNHSCGVSDVSIAVTLCWGDNRSSQVNPSRNEDFLPLPTLAFVDQALSAGSFHTCRWGTEGDIACWGSNGNFQLGTDDTSAESAGFLAPPSTLDTIGIAAGGAHTCSLRANGRVLCWGANGFGQLGTGDRTPSAAPLEVSGITNAVALSSVRDHTCALLATGIVLCWGRNDFGQADGTPGGDRLVPTPVASLSPGDAVGVTTGFQHTCILTPGGTVRCWGRNNSGQLGNDTTTDSTAPVTVRRIGTGRTPTVTILTDVVGIVSEAEHNCALRTTGQPHCWGRNPEGQLGDGSRTTRRAAIGLASFTANIARNASLSANARIAHVDALVNCEEGGRFIAEITVTQGAVSGAGHVSGACIGGLASHSLVVPARGAIGFAPGSAVAHADIVVHRGGEVIDEQEWTRAIVIAP